MFSLDNLIKQYTDKRHVFSVMIELCTICNWNCDYCYLENHSEYGISLDELKVLLLELREAGCFQITYTGGEIFLRKDIWDIIKFTRSLGFEVILFTNFSLLTEKQIDDLKKYNIAKISCSIFSLNNEINNSFIHSSNESLKNVLSNINYAKKLGISVEIKVMIMKFNYEEINDFILYSQQNEIPVIFDYQILPNRSCDTSNIKKYMVEGANLKKMIMLDDRGYNNYKSVMK